MPLGTHLLSWNGVWRARNEITRILNSGSTFAEPKFNIRFHENSGPKFEFIARTNDKCHFLNVDLCNIRILNIEFSMLNFEC